MHLLIDVGNSRVKWLLVDNEFDDSLEIHYGNISDLENFIKEIDVSKTEVLLAAVNQTQELSTLLNNSGFRKVTIARSQLEQAGVINSYDQAERMGIDRWLAMIAAHASSLQRNEKQGVIVVDAGSALTIDVLKSDGVHLGGYIVPGLLMAQSALFANTERVVRYDEAIDSGSQLGKYNKLGNNTLQCVEYGVINQLVALVQSVIDQHSGYEIIFTGGDGEMLAGFFTTGIVDKNLVLKGLWQVRN